MQSKSPIVKDLVLVGGGHSHVAVLKRFAMAPVDGVRVTVVSREIHTPYSGMLPGLIAGHYTHDEAHIDLRPLCRAAGARLIAGEAVGLALDARRVLVAGRPAVAYDRLSIDIGSTPSTAGVPGAREHALAVKPVSRFLEGWQALRRRIAAEPDRRWRVVVVGAGAGGVELLLSIEHRLADLRQRGADLGYTLFSATDAIVPTHNPGVRRRLRRILDERGVEVRAGQRVVGVEADRLETGDGQVEPYDALLWVTDAAAPGWLAETGLELTERGFIAVDDHLRSLSHPEVFAAGDVATVVDQPRPKSGVMAVRQGPPLAENLRRSLLGQPLRRVRLQKRFLSLISTGDRHAVASRGRLAVEGGWVWRWKDWIDRRWMAQWTEVARRMAAIPADAARPDRRLLDAEAIAALGEPAMRCGGCGAKVGKDLLDEALARLEPTSHADVVVGLGAPDDAAVIRVPAGKLAVQSVDYFRAFIDDPYVFGKVAANHALGDLWAMGAKPHAALAIATLPYAAEDKTAETLYQLMAGVTEVLGQAGCALVGGHTGEGAELGCGLQVQGLVDPDGWWSKAGAQPGDRLIVTRPIGTGVIFAADMRAKARGRWVEAALGQMVRPSGPAAAVLRDHGARACTDVTGFGLLGHLGEMLGPQGLTARVDLEAVPILAGARELVRQGIFSSMQPHNVRLRRLVDRPERLADDPRFALLFDPQTAGGLLAAVPAERAAACLVALVEAGEAEAAIIGQVRAPDAASAPVAFGG